MAAAPVSVGTPAPASEYSTQVYYMSVMTACLQMPGIVYTPQTTKVFLWQNKTILNDFRKASKAVDVNTVTPGVCYTTAQQVALKSMPTAFLAVLGVCKKPATKKFKAMFSVVVNLLPDGSLDIIELSEDTEQPGVHDIPTDDSVVSQVQSTSDTTTQS